MMNNNHYLRADGFLSFGTIGSILSRTDKSDYEKLILIKDLEILNGQDRKPARLGFFDTANHRGSLTECFMALLSEIAPLTPEAYSLSKYLKKSSTFQSLKLGWMSYVFEYDVPKVRDSQIWARVSGEPVPTCVSMRRS
jgi:hypothetical protein